MPILLPSNPLFRAHMPWPCSHAGSGIKTDQCLSHSPNPSYPSPGATNWKPPFSPGTFHLHTAIGSKTLQLGVTLPQSLRQRQEDGRSFQVNGLWGQNYALATTEAAPLQGLLEITTWMPESNPTEKDYFLTRVTLDSLGSELRYRCIYDEAASRGWLHPPQHSV